MSLFRQSCQWMAVVVTILTASAARSQHLTPYQDFTFADPMEFKPDFQWFAPVDTFSLQELSPQKRANVGWFATYDRTRPWVTRPESVNTADSPKGAAGDLGWGNRYDLGFMRDTGSGWLFTFRSMNVDRYHTHFDEIVAGQYDVIVDFIGNIVEAPGPFNYDAFPVRNSINVGSLNNFELNKTWRLSPYRYGGILEPLIGMRYGTFRDRALVEEFELFSILDDPLDPDSDVTDFAVWGADRVSTLNQMLGGQLGFRYFNHYHRWKLSTEFRAFMAANFQTSTRTLNGFTANLTDDELSPFVSDQSYLTNQATVWGFEVRAEAAYQVTRDIAIRGGFEAIDFGRGIWRGGYFDPASGEDFSVKKNQFLFMAGLTFGLELNR